MSKTSSTTRRRATRRRRASNGWALRWFVVGIGLVALLGIGASFARTLPTEEIPGLQMFSIESAAHRTGPISYPQTPPASGPHAASWQNCGIYDQPIPSETAVHSLEHGAVWLTYHPALAPADVERLRDLTRGRTHVLLSPFPDLPTPVVASAWGLQLQVDSADDARLGRFVQRFAQGPQTPEPGAACIGGVGTPIGR